jgi:hypothetical protein
MPPTMSLSSGEVKAMAAVAPNVASPLLGWLREEVEVGKVAAVLRVAGFGWRHDDNSALAR